MKKTMNITLPKRNNTPQTQIYCEIYSVNQELGKRQVLLMIPGGPGNDLSTYNSAPFSIADALAPYIDIILFDPRGCGRNEACDSKYCSLEEYIEDIEAIRQHFNLASDNFILFGQSYGSVAALGYAVKYGSYLKKLFLIGAVANGNFLREALDELKLIGNTAQKKYIDIMWQGQFSQSQEAINDYYKVMGPLFSYTYDPTKVQASLSYNAELMNYGFGDFLKRFDFTPKLKNIKCNVLILWGENEWIINQKQVELVASHIANCELKKYQQCSHLLWIDQWDKFIADAIEFIVK